MGVCNGGHARKHFPKRSWEIGSKAVALADFAWDAENSLMLYFGWDLKYGEPLKRPEFPEPGRGIRLYTLEEATAILRERGLVVDRSYGAYDTSVPLSDDTFTLIVCSRKLA